MTLPSGTRLGPYEILSPLGAGGMGEVYRARDTRLDREVAVKVLSESLARDPAALARFEREAKAVAALSHPNILAVHDFGQADGTTYAVMELLEGESLRQRLAEGPLPQKKAVEIAREVALGVAAAADKGIVHRDLKPENLFLTQDGRVKILDFGLARQVALPSGSDTHSPTAVRVSEPGMVLGTAGYMSPEQLRGQPADSRSDIFSLGAVLYEMLSGRRAFGGDTAIEAMNAILKEDPPELSRPNRPIALALARVVTHCLEKRPEDRFQSARDLAFDLATLSTTSSATAGTAAAELAKSGSSRRGRFLVVAGAGVGLAGLALAFWAGAHLPFRASPEVGFRRLTFRRGNILSARFAPDGQTVVYGAAWEGKPSALFSVRTDSVESRPLGLDQATVLSVSSRGELAVLLRKGSFQRTSAGTLARMPIGGGAPRELQEEVQSAQWAPDGEEMAIVRNAPDGRGRLEYPIGHPLFDSFGLGPVLAVSRDGDSVVFADTDNFGESTIWTVNRRAQKRLLAKGLWDLGDLATSTRTDEVYFIARTKSGSPALRAVSLSGRQRVVWPGAQGCVLHDVAPDGRVLVERFVLREGLIWAAPGVPERELGWLDGTELRDLSRDGRQILFTELGEGAGPNHGAYIRGTDGSPAVRLGDGEPFSLSPDGKWVLTVTRVPPEIVLLPTGSGSPRKVAVRGIQAGLGLFLGDGKRIAVLYIGSDRVPQIAVVGVEGGKPLLVPTVGVNADGGFAISPDGTLFAYPTVNRTIMLANLDGGQPRPLPGPGLLPRETISEWSGDGRFVIVQNHDVPTEVFRIDVRTGERSPWTEIQPADRSGIVSIGTVLFTPDGSGHAYSYRRTVASDLYVVDGLR